MATIIYNGNTPEGDVTGQNELALKVYPFGMCFQVDNDDIRIVGRNVNASFELEQTSELDLNSLEGPLFDEAWAFHPNQTFVYYFTGSSSYEPVAAYDTTTGEFVGEYGVDSSSGTNGPGVIENGVLSSNKDADGNNYLLGFGFNGYNMHLMDIDTEDGVPTYLDHLNYGAGGPTGGGAFAPLPPGENGDARWIFSQCGAVVDVDEFPQRYNLVTYTGGSLVLTELAEWIGVSDSPFTGNLNVNQVGMIVEDRENGQWIFVHEDDTTSNCIVGAVSKSDTSTLVWETILPDGLNGYYQEYCGSVIQGSLLGVPCTDTAYLIDTRDGSILDQGSSPSAAAPSAAYWDGNSRALFITSADEEVLLHRVEFTNVPPRGAPDESTNAIDEATILRSSDITAVVDANAVNIQTLLEGLVDATPTNNPSLTIDLNGYELSNLAPDSGDDNEVARQASE